MNIQVYTANIGEHDPPRIKELETYPLVIFTEDLLGDPLLSARFYKTCPHLLFPEADWTIWVDANVWLNVCPEELVRKIQEKQWHKYFGVFQHTWHNNIWEEAEAVLKGGFDINKRIQKTLQRWVEYDPDTADQAMTMVLVRRNTIVNAQRNAGWWQDICYGSRRDQLSFGLHYPGPYWPTVDFTKPNKYFTRVL